MPLTSSMEDYIEAVFILKQQHGYVRCVDVAEFLEVKKPSVSRAVKELSKKKCLIKKDNRLPSKFMKSTNSLQSSLLRQAFPMILRHKTLAGWNTLSVKQVLRN